MTTNAHPLLPVIARNWRDDAVWVARLEADRVRAERNQTSSQRLVSATVIERALSAGAEAVALTGSTARGRRTATSDLDRHPHRGSTSALRGSERRPRPVRNLVGSPLGTSTGGDDFIQWTLRFGCILIDHGVFREVLTEIAETGRWPDPQHKRDRADELLGFAERIIATGDLDAAQDQTRAAVTAVARWLLLANREFPLARDELSAQVLALGCFDLAAAVSRLIHAEPCLDELATAVEIGRLVISLPPNRARRAALAR